MRWQVKPEADDAELRLAREEGRRQGRDEMLDTLRVLMKPKAPTNAGASRAATAGTSAGPSLPTAPAPARPSSHLCPGAHPLTINRPPITYDAEGVGTCQACGTRVLP